MSDWRETKEAQEQDVPQRTAGEKLTSQGISSIQGNVDAQGSEAREAAKQPDDTDDLVTVRPHKNPETLPSPEVEGRTIKDPKGKTEDSEGKIKLPKEWQPGSPERGW